MGYGQTDPLGQEAWTDQQQRIQDELAKRPPHVLDLTQDTPVLDSMHGGTSADLADELEHWWVKTAGAEVEGITAKMREYGGHGRALDLIEIGRALVTAGLPLGDDPSDADLAEAGCYFYLVGKFARWTAAISEGRKVSDDTLYDIGVYIRMTQRIRSAGGWPV